MVVKQQLSKTKGPFRCERNGGMDAQKVEDRISNIQAWHRGGSSQEVLCIRWT